MYCFSSLFLYKNSPVLYTYWKQQKVTLIIEVVCTVTITRSLILGISSLVVS